MLDIENFDLKLDTEFIGRNFIILDEIGSTNSELLSGKKTYKESGTVLFAEKQLQGKGRLDRIWYSMKDQNLTFSILLSNQESFRKKLSLINLCSSLAIANSIENLYQLKCELKWPNDVLINKKKVSGILIETSIQGKKIDRIVIGMGINVNQNSFQGEFNIPPTSIKLELNHSVERETLLAEVLNNFEELINILNKNPEHILHEWRMKCRMIGDKITIQTQNGQRTGIFDDIDEEGFLLLKQKDKTEKIHYGDVSLS
jgi:BirA family transcriptional regulator, biotin operon repressor / biotin---[acetyl-CoA-carboxylase] ligase